MRSLDEMNAKLDALAESQGKLLAALNEHDEWAKRMNADALKKNDAHSAQWDESAKSHKEAGEAVVELLKKMLARVGYMETVINNIYDFQRRPAKRPKRKKR